MGRRRVATAPGVALAVALALSAAASGCTQVLGFGQHYYGPFCQGLSPQPVFCDDFDENEPNPYGWSFAHTTTGNLALDNSQYVSWPASLLAQTNVVTSECGTVDTSVYQTLQLSGQTFDGTLELDLRVDGVDYAGGVAVLAQFGLTDGSGGGLYYLQLVTTSNGKQPLTLQVAEDYFATSTTGKPVDHSVSSVIPVGIWTHVKLSMAVPFAGGAGTATLVIGDDPAAVSAIDVPVQDFGASITIGVGILYASTPSNGWTAAFDNVVFNSASN
jgi:hypothetical protein